jgi:hypothetical protein
MLNKKFDPAMAINSVAEISAERGINPKLIKSLLESFFFFPPIVNADSSLSSGK